MENLNAEQVKKALECCATKQFCAFDSPCPWEYMHGGNRLYADALALITSQEQRIKELTEENERLKAQRYYIYPNGRIEMIPTVESVKADTVRKMQERTAEIIGELVELMFDDNMPNCIVPHCRKPDDIGCGHKICIYENKEMWLERLDQIAKELVEGAPDNG